MASSSQGGGRVTRLTLWIVNRTARLLDADERDAVLGDFLEADASFGRALADLLGLIARRQVAVAREWRTWFAFCGLVLPVAALVFYVSLHTVRIFHLSYWIIENYRHFDPKILEEANYTFGQRLEPVLRHGSLLILWSFAGGFVLVSMARRAVLLNLILLVCLACFAVGAVLGVPAGPPPTFVISVCIGFVGVPLIVGVTLGLRRVQPTTRIATSFASLVGLLTAYAFWSGGWWRGTTPHLIQLALAVILSWPIAYILLAASRGEAVDSTSQ